jgi:uncharacterized membrane protein YhaH (DUF805 family)
MNWYLDVLRKYAQFDGRARRTEFWMFSLINCVIQFVYISAVMLAAVVLGDRGSSATALLMIPLVIYAFAVIIPGLAVTVRRLHDTGRSGAYFLIAFIPLAGPIILLVFECQDSQPGPNLYGPNPKEVPAYLPIGPGLGY